MTEFGVRERRVLRWANRCAGYAAVLTGVGLSRWLFGPDDDGAVWSAWLACVSGAVLLASIAASFGVHLRRARRRGMETP